MRIADLEFEPFLDQSDIESAIEKVAGDVAKDYEHKTPLFIGVLNGSFRFVSEFIKHYPHSCEVRFVKL